MGVDRAVGVRGRDARREPSVEPASSIPRPIAQGSSDRVMNTENGSGA